MQCEHLEHPLGVDATTPRLSWQMEDDRRGAAQIAWQVLVGTDSAAVRSGRGDMWESGRSNDPASQVEYAGKPLQPFTRYFWSVQIWNEKDQLSAPALSFFETGMMEKFNWQGAWISDNKSIAEKAAPYFRKEFNIAKKIKSARAYIAVAGLYELYLNGEKLGNHRLDPMYTRFDRRLLYVTYDVTDQLRNGANAIGVLPGNGWYNMQSTAVWDFHKAPWRGRPTFCMDLRITYTDGSIETIRTDKSWKTNLSPVIFNSIYTAEHYDARLEQDGWNKPGYDDKKWSDVIFRSAPADHIISQSLYPVRNVDTIDCKSMQKFSNTNYVFDMGRNFSGVAAITVEGPAGTILQLKHGERLYKNGHVDQSNIDVHYRPTDSLDPFQTDIYILKGGGAETFLPHFNYKGFQYVELSSDHPLVLRKEDMTAYFMHSDVPVIGAISSSNPVINQIWWATNNSYLSNLFGYPTDCPQREKNGWTGDTHIAIQTGLYNFDAITVYEKWMADHRDEQQPNGVLSSIIPTDGWGYEWGNGPDWTSTIAIIPWNLYLFYGDSKALSDCYDNIKKYVDHIDELYPSGLTSLGLGDWVPVKSVSPVELTSTAYYYTDVSILASAAALFQKNDYANYYRQLAEKIKAAFNEKYLDRGKGIYGNGLQTELAVPLYLHLVPEDQIASVAKNLADSVKANDYHLDCGILGTKAILPALSENGYADVAYKLAAQTSYPSWGWWMVNGATTLYENWKIDAQNDISLNHIMFGGIGGWLYSGIAGIQPDPEQPGFQHFLLKPQFVCDSFSATHQSMNGAIKSSWQKKKNALIYTVVISANSSATLRLPAVQIRSVQLDGKKQTDTSFNLKAGTYIFNCKLK